MQTNKRFVLPIIAACILAVIISFIPPYQSPAQVGRVTDSVDVKMNRIERNVQVAESKVDSNAVKTRSLISWLLKTETKPRKPLKPQNKGASPPREVLTDGFSGENAAIIEVQYINRPIILQPACRIYGGDDFRKYTYSEWKAQRGLLQNKSYRLYEKYLNDETVK